MDRERRRNGFLAAMTLGLLLAACSGERGPTGPAGPAGNQGPQGPQGPAGAEGSPGAKLIYGTGSNAFVAPAGESNLDLAITSFTDFTVPAGSVLHVESGTLIRCTGTFQVEGELVVKPGAFGGFGYTGGGLGTYFFKRGTAEAGHSLRAPTAGEFGTSGSLRERGEGGLGLTPSPSWAWRVLPYPGIKAGGAGMGSYNTNGGHGGGSLVVLAQQGISVAGSIRANGAASVAGGGGGGGGGILILASATSVNAPGTLSANGGAGAISTFESGPGGGGGGGTILAIAPTVSLADAITLGGVAGPNSVNVTFSNRFGGGGGGASYGNGGAGGSVPAGATVTPLPADSGTAGFVGIAEQDPAGLF